MTIFCPTNQGASSKCKGNSVDFPAPGGASKITIGYRNKASFKAGITSWIGRSVDILRAGSSGEMVEGLMWMEFSLWPNGFRAARNGPTVGSRGRQPPVGRSLERCAPKEPSVFAAATDTSISQWTNLQSSRNRRPFQGVSWWGPLHRTLPHPATYRRPILGAKHNTKPKALIFPPGTGRLLVAGGSSPLVDDPVDRCAPKEPPVLPRLSTSRFP